jgi:hypothetical protein
MENADEKQIFRRDCQDVSGSNSACQVVLNLLMSKKFPAQQFLNRELT